MFICLFLILTGCGTATKIADHGPVELNRVDGDNRPFAPVILIYNFHEPNDRHEIFFWDQDKNRFNLKIEGVDTTKGILFYLPANRSYALSGMLHVKTYGRIEYSFGTDLPLFEVRAGQITQIPYFEVIPTDDGFRIMKTKPDDQSKYQSIIADRFGTDAKIRAVKALD
jgi:hypothetical protein